MKEKTEFAERLRDAMTRAGHAARPSVLEREFNTRYWGKSVTLQAVSRWLNGQAIPSQDKLQVLADLLHMEPQVLRFGDRASRRSRVQEAALPSWLATADRQDRAAIEAFLGLPASQRKLARELIIALAKPPRR